MRVATKLGRIPGLIIGSQAAFWFMAFFCLPLYLLTVKPAFEVQLADFRVAAPTYDAGMAPILWISSLGIAVYVVTLYVLCRLRRTKARAEVAPLKMQASFDELRPVAGCLWILGWVGRVGLYTGNDSLDSAFSTFATVGSSLLIVSVREKKPRALTPLVSAIILAEMIWAFTFASKAALIIPLVALGIRWMVRHSNKSLRTRLVIVALVACAGFLVLQPLKGITTAREVSAASTSDFAAVTGAVVSVLERFDGFSAVTDAYYIQAGSWLSLDQFATRLGLAAVPKGPFLKVEASTGQYWAQEVRAQSTPAEVVSGVSLAAGGTAEGYALFGVLGVLLECFVLAAIALLASLALQSGSSWKILYASNFVFSTVLYEQGLLGVAASSNKALQVLVVGFVLLMIFRSRKVADRRKRVFPYAQLH